MSDGFDRTELIAVFTAECDENLSTLEELLVRLEDAPNDDEIINTIFRSAHTLKGNAATMGFEGVTRIAHVMEDVLQRVRQRQLAADSVLITLLLLGADALRAAIPEALAGNDALSADVQLLLADLAGAASGARQSAHAAAEKGDSAAPRPAAGGRRIRVAREKLDRLLNLTSEIVIASGRARATAESLAAGSGRQILIESLAETERLFAEMQEQVTQIRLVPVAATFEQHKRTVRDIAQATQKNVRLVVEGADAEVDASVIEHIKDPLLHMIRNAIDHGIESAEQRLAAGKPAQGTITLRARHEAGSIIIEVADDGAGLDRERIVAHARERGLVGATQVLSDADIDQLIFLPGFTTSDEVSDLSGRGVGMDVVSRNVSALRGVIEISSEAGRGTAVSMRLPLTLAVLDALALEAGGERFVVPLDAVDECVELPAAQRDGRPTGVVAFRGTPLPYIRLSNFYQLDPVAGARENVIVVKAAGGAFGLVADRLLGEMKAVIKPLGKLFRRLAGVSGSTLFGDGRVGLILDVAGLARETVRRESDIVRIPHNV